MSAPLTRDQLEVVARVHITSEVIHLVMSALPIQAATWRPSEAGLSDTDLAEWFEVLRLESAMMHTRCLFSFLTGTTRRLVGPYGSDVVAQDYFLGHWTPPALVIGEDIEDQSRVIASIDTRIHQIGRDRLAGPYPWEQVRQHALQVVGAFDAFVTALESDGGGERADWFLDGIRFAKHLEG